MEIVRIEGLRDLENALRELPKATARAALRRTLKIAAKPVEDAMRAKAPVETGGLRDSIITGTRLTRRQAAAAKKETKHFSEIHIGTSHPAAVPQEFGTILHAAQPFGRPAWEETQTGALVDISRELGGEIEKSRERLARKAARLAAKR